MYKFSLKTSLKDIGEHVGYMFVSLILFTNLVVIAKNIGINILHYASAKLASAVLCGGLMVIFYFLYVRSKRYLNLIAKYNAETKNERSIRIFLVTTYIATSFLTFLFL
jgi:hypothetical protein